MVTDDVCSYASFNDDGTVFVGGVIKENTLMQYTGLKDKNGKEIYEGDIMTSDSKSQSLKVVFESGGFCFANDLASGSDRLHPDRVGRLQIIGNIYEHPELLKQ